MNRREFIKYASIGLLGSLVFPKVASAKRVSKELIRSILESQLHPLTKKVIQIESNWEYWKEGKEDDVGLMQIRPLALEDWNENGPGRLYGKYDLFDPFVNVMVGEWYLHERIGNHYLNSYNLRKSPENKLACYNAGPTKIGRKVGDAIENFSKLPETTKKYLINYWALS